MNSKEKLIRDFIKFLAKDARYICGTSITEAYCRTGCEYDKLHWRENEGKISELISEFLSKQSEPKL